MIKAVIFDWSGVLGDDLEATFDACNEVLKERKLRQITMTEYKEYYSLPWSNFYKPFGIEIDLAEEYAMWNRILPKHLHKAKPYPFTKKVLEQIKEKNIEIVVFSSRAANSIEKEIAGTGIEPLIDKIYDGLHNKTSTVEDFMKSHKLSRKSVMYIGDTVHDIETAKHAGVISVAVLSGYDKKEKLLAKKPDYQVESATEIPSLIEKINSRK